MLEAIAAGEDDPEKLAQMARKGLRKKLPQLSLALEGRIRDHHRFLLRQLLVNREFGPSFVLHLTDINVGRFGCASYVIVT